MGKMLSVMKKTAQEIMHDLAQRPQAKRLAQTLTQKGVGAEIWCRPGSYKGFWAAFFSP